MKRKKSFKRYLLDVNEFFGNNLFGIIPFTGKSSPPYDVKTKDIFNLWNKKEIYQTEWALINTDIHSKISMKTVNAMFSSLKKHVKDSQKIVFGKMFLCLSMKVRNIKHTLKQNHNL